MSTINYSINILNQELIARKTRNKSYSMRSFANALSISPATLSSILKGKRQIPVEQVESIGKKLKLSPKKFGLFMTSALDGRLNKVKIENTHYERKILDEKLHYKIIAEWEYYAFLSLIRLEDFNPDLAWTSKKLGITKKRADVVIKDLLKAKLITQDETNNFHRMQDRYYTSDNVHSKALIASHKESLEIAAQKLTELEPLLRDFTSLTFTGNIAQMAKAKALIREFKDNIDELFSNENFPASDIFQLNIQLYPITNIDQESHETN